MNSSRSQRVLWIVGGAFAVALLLAIAAPYLGVVWEEGPSPDPNAAFISEPRPMSTPFINPGLRQPPLTPAPDALIADEDEVVGVTFPSAARAYHLGSMNTISRCVINDLMDGTPVSVTYDRGQDVVQVFTRSGSREPLPIEVGGVFHGRLLLRINGRFFSQATGKALSAPDQPEELLVEPMRFQRQPWRIWRQQYPDSLVFVVMPPKSSKDH